MIFIYLNFLGDYLTFVITSFGKGAGEKMSEKYIINACCALYGFVLHYTSSC